MYSGTKLGLCIWGDRYFPPPHVPLPLEQTTLQITFFKPCVASNCELSLRVNRLQGRSCVIVCGQTRDIYHQKWKACGVNAWKGFYIERRLWGDTFPFRMNYLKCSVSLAHIDNLFNWSLGTIRPWQHTRILSHPGDLLPHICICTHIHKSTNAVCRTSMAVVFCRYFIK